MRKVLNEIFAIIIMVLGVVALAITGRKENVSDILKKASKDISGMSPIDKAKLGNKLFKRGK